MLQKDVAEPVRERPCEVEAEQGAAPLLRNEDREGVKSDRHVPIGEAVRSGDEHESAGTLAGPVRDHGVPGLFSKTAAARLSASLAGP